MSRISRFLIAGALAAFVTPASATLIVTSGNTSGGTNVISVSGCGPTGAPNTTVTGCLQNNKSLDVIFQSTADTVQEDMAFAAGGQAKLIATQGVDPNEVAGDWGYNNFTVSLGSGYVFGKIVMNIEVFEATDINFLDSFGQTALIHLDGTGNGFVTVYDDLGDMSWLQVTSNDRTINLGTKKDPVYITDGDINDVKQVRLIGVNNPNCTENCNPPPVPEPASIALLGVGLLGAGFVGRRKKRS